MSAQEGSRRKAPAAKPDEGTKRAAETAEAGATAEEQARRKEEEALTEAQETAAAARAESEEERQAQVKTKRARSEAARPSTEARKASEAQAENLELSRTALEEAGAEQPVSFAVRLTVDARGQILRTQVEHAQSRKKETFPTLDVQRLAAFMKACISLPPAQEPAIHPEPSPARAGIPTPKSPRPASDLTVSDVRVFRIGAPGVSALTLNPAEACVVQARFQLQGPEAAALTTHDSAFEIKVYATALTGGTPGLLTTYNANLVKDVLDYTAQMPAPGLSPGLYRLITRVTLPAPTKMVGYHEGPIIEVIGEPSISPAAPTERSR